MSEQELGHSAETRASETNLARTLVDRLFDRRDGQLVVSGHQVSELAAAFGSPLYIYSESILERSWDLLRATYPPEFDIYYSMKANPQRAFLKFFLSRGAGLEVASGGELARAMASGCPVSRILYAGPGKTDEELAMAIRARIGEIHVESAGELDRLERLAASQDTDVAVALRVNPASPSQNRSMVMGGRASPFGIDEEQLPELIARRDDWPHLRWLGIHLNTGTQWLDAQALLEQYQHGWKIATQLAPHCTSGLRTVDFGGGLGIPYFAGERPLDFETLRIGLRDLVQTAGREAKAELPRLLIEPGRFLVGECGLYVARVVDVKFSRGQRFVVCDGGMHHHAAATGNFGQTLRRPFPLAVANRLDAPCVGPASIVGPLCTPLDTFARNLPWPEVVPGDLMVVFQSGAYAKTASPLEFLGHRRPVEVWVGTGGSLECLERRGDWGAM